MYLRFLRVDADRCLDIQLRARPCVPYFPHTSLQSSSDHQRGVSSPLSDKHQINLFSGLRGVRIVFSATRQACWFFLIVKTREFVVNYILRSITLFINVSRTFHVYFQEWRGVESQPLTLSYIQHLLCSVRAIRVTITTRGKSSSS